MKDKQWPPQIVRDDAEWTDDQRAMWDARYAEIVALGWSTAPKSIEELLTNHHLIDEHVPAEHAGYFTRVLLSSELVRDIATRIVALETRS